MKKATLSGLYNGEAVIVEVSANTADRFHRIKMEIQRSTTDHLVMTGELLRRILQYKNRKKKDVSGGVLTGRDVRRFVRAHERRLKLFGGGSNSL